MATGVLVDANVLFSRTLRDWLSLLRNQTEGGMFVVYATEDVLAETIYRYRRQHPNVSGQQITRIRDLIVAQLDDRVTEYVIDGSFPGADQNDAHVHAAAVASGAKILLTADTGWSDLDDNVLEGLPYEVYAPDAFFMLVDATSSNAVRNVTRTQLDYWYARNGEADLPERLRAAACPEFARRVSEHIRTLDWEPEM